MQTKTKAHLSPRESDVLIGLAKGFTYDEIAQILGLSPNTIRTHIKSLYGKFQVSSRSEVVFEALQLGDLDLSQIGVTSSNRR